MAAVSASPPIFHNAAVCASRSAALCQDVWHRGRRLRIPSARAVGRARLGLSRLPLPGTCRGLVAQLVRARA